jgi:ketosteroid isomerase-like protein
MSIANEAHAKDRQEILAHIDSIFQAFARRDREALMRTHLPNWKGFIARSRQVIRDRDQYLQDVERVLMHQHFSTWELSDVDFAFHGDTAIVCYIARVSGELPNGHTFEYKLRIMDIYQRTPKGWNLAASSVSVHPDEIDRHLSSLAAMTQPF